MKLRVFGLGGSEDFAADVANKLDITLSPHVERRFDDGEIYVRSEENVRGCDVFVISSLYSDEKLSAGEKLTTLSFFIGSLTDASAGRVTVVSPYLAYARQDRKTESRAPITTKYVAKMLEAQGCSRLLTMDVHNLSSFQNAFRIPTDNLEAKLLFVDYLTGIDKRGNAVAQRFPTALPKPEEIVVLSPDSGGMSRARKFREGLEKRLKATNKISLAYFDKERLTGSEVRGDKIVGDVKGKHVIVLDDMISSGSTIHIATDAVTAYGGKIHAVCASHGLFIGKANDYLSNLPVLVTDTIRPFRSDPTRMHLHQVSTTALFASAVRRTHEDGGSISQLLEE